MRAEIISHLVVAAVIALIGCRSPGESVQSASASKRPLAQQSAETKKESMADALAALIAAQGSATFRSHNGKWIGMDDDSELTFLPGGAVLLLEAGEIGTFYRGTYAIDSGGIVTLRLQLKDWQSEPGWPATVLRRDEKSLYLSPGADGQVKNPGRSGYWPLRVLSASEEAERRTLKGL